MKLQTWNVINANGDIIDIIKTGGKRDIAIASAKIAHKYGKNSVFLKVEYKGIEEV
jgi:hypothetical protein